MGTLSGMSTLSHKLKSHPWLSSHSGPKLFLRVLAVHAFLSSLCLFRCSSLGLCVSFILNISSLLFSFLFLVFSILLIFFLLLQLYRYSVFTTYALNITPNFKLLMNFFVHKTWTEKSGVYKFVLKQDQECELPINRGASLQCYMQLPRTLKCLWRGLGLGRWRTDFNVICGFSLWHPLTALKCCSLYQNGGGLFDWLSVQTILQKMLLFVCTQDNAKIMH